MLARIQWKSLDLHLQLHPAQLIVYLSVSSLGTCKCLYELKQMKSQDLQLFPQGLDIYHNEAMREETERRKRKKGWERKVEKMVEKEERN